MQPQIRTPLRATLLAAPGTTCTRCDRQAANRTRFGWTTVDIEARRSGRQGFAIALRRSTRSRFPSVRNAADVIDAIRRRCRVFMRRIVRAVSALDICSGSDCFVGHD
jgi:hypothetical protein